MCIPLLWGGPPGSLGTAGLLFPQLASPGAVFHSPPFGLLLRDFAPQPWGKANWLGNSHFLPAVRWLVIEFPREAVLGGGKEGWGAAFVWDA